MRKNRIIATIWLTVIFLIVAAMVGYIIYAAIENPYFVSKDAAFIHNFGNIFFEKMIEVSRENF